MIPTVRQTLINVLSRTETDDITVRQLCLLLSLYDGPRTVRDVTYETSIAKPSVSRAADMWEKLGYVQRQDDPNDRRSVLMVLSKAGRRYLDNIVKA